MDEDLKFERLAILSALEAQNGEISKLGLLKALEIPFIQSTTGNVTPKLDSSKKIQKELGELVQKIDEGGGTTFRITEEGRAHLFSPENTSYLMEMFGKTAENMGGLSGAYGKILKKAAASLKGEPIKSLTRKKKKAEVSVQEFQEKLNKALQELGGISGWASIKEVQSFLAQELEIPSQRVKYLFQKTVKGGGYELASGDEEENINILGGVYGLIRRE